MKKITTILALSLAMGLQAQQHVMTVDVAKPTAKIQPTMYGIFFEDINYGADGGLYAEMLENRSFEFLDARGDKDAYHQIFNGLYGWSAYPKE